MDSPDQINLKSVSIVLSFEEARNLLQAAQVEEAKCQSLKLRSEKQLEDATAQLAEVERQLFDAQSNLGYIRYILRKSNLHLPELEPSLQNRTQNVIQINGGECIL